MERLLFIFSFLLLSHLFFEKKDKFFIFRALASVTAFAILFYLSLKHFGVDPDLIDYSLMFFGVSLLVGLVRYLKTGNFNFIYPEKKDFDVKGIVKGLLLVGFIFLVCLIYFRELITLPHYVTIDAPLHFSRFRNFVEYHYKSDDSAGASVLLFVFSNLFLYSFKGVEKVLADFQLANILLFALTSVYFYLLWEKRFKIKSRLLRALAFILTTFGFFFNLFIFGFLPQIVSLFLLFCFWDLYAELKKNRLWIVCLLALGLSIFSTYFFWCGVLGIYLGLVTLKCLLKSKNKWGLLLKLSPLAVIGVWVIVKKIKVLGMADLDGETYKVFTANFWMFAPFFLGGLHLALKKWKRDDSEFSSGFLASLLVFLIFFAGYLKGYVSSYTLFKGIFLTGSFIYFFSIYFLDQKQQKSKSGGWRKFNLAFTGAIIALMLYPIVPWGTKNQLQANLVSSFDNKDIWSLKQRPLDVFYFNVKAFEDRDNQVENVVSFDQDKIEFLRNLRPYLPKDFQGYYAFYDPYVRHFETRMMMAADFKTSYWVFGLTKIWNRSLDVMEVHNTKIIDYDDWVKNHHDPYFMILDTQTTNRWLWMNEDKFKWENFEILYAYKGNYLLKWKEE